jgi:hypothetical protein
MEIEKIKITQAMRKEATKLAIQHKFKKVVEEYDKKLVSIVTDYVLNYKCNKDAIDTYKNLTEDFKQLVRLESAIYLKTNKDDDKTHSENIMTEITSNMTYLKEDHNDSYFPFCSSNKAYTHNQNVKLTFSYPLIKHFFDFDKNKVPVKIQKHLNFRKELIEEINDFANNTYHALCHVKSIKDIRENIPALEQFIPVPEKQFTQLVPYAFFQKVNKSVNI